MGLDGQTSVPAVLLALNFAAVAVILLLTFVLGRLYCSVICPLGVFQDIIIAIRRFRDKLAMKRFASRMKKLKARGEKLSGAGKVHTCSFSFRKETGSPGPFSLSLP